MPIIAILYSISFFISGILLQQPRAPLEDTFRICIALSSRKWEDERYLIFLGRCHNNSWTHSPQTWSCNKNGGVLELFSRFRRGTENEDSSESKNFFAEVHVFQIKSGFVLAKKNLGVRCTLRRPIWVWLTLIVVMVMLWFCRKNLLPSFVRKQQSTKKKDKKKATQSDQGPEARVF